MQIILSRRNLLTLLSKLDRKKAGEITACTIVKPNNIVVIAAEDEEVYKDRAPGPIHPRDKERVEK